MTTTDYFRQAPPGDFWVASDLADPGYLVWGDATEIIGDHVPAAELDEMIAELWQEADDAEVAAAIEEEMDHRPGWWR